MFKDLFRKRLIMFVAFVISVFIIFKSFASGKNFEFLDPYEKLLNNHVYSATIDGVDLNVVDYNSWRNDFDHDLALEYLKKANPEELKGDEKIAFWINAYNLLTIDLIIDRKEKESIKKIGGVLKNPWTSYRWKIGDKKYNLETIEHKILRKMDDPRIHFAIVCASVSCPDLIKKPYYPEFLDSQLRKSTISFLANEGKGLEIVSDNEIIVSKIFDWFKKDFGGKSGVLEFIRKHNNEVYDDAEVSGYLDYNWGLNVR